MHWKRILISILWSCTILFYYLYRTHNNNLVYFILMVDSFVEGLHTVIYKTEEEVEQDINEKSEKHQKFFNRF